MKCMATLAEVEEAVQAARAAGAEQIALLKCTSAYPAPAEEMNLRTIPDLAQRFGVPVGLSDHTRGVAVPVVAVAMGGELRVWQDPSLGSPEVLPMGDGCCSSG